MWELDHEESWALKNWCFWTVVLEETLESPLDSKEIQPVHPKGVQSWVFIGRTDAEAEALILWPPHVKSWEGLGAGGEGDDRGWDGWMASPTWWTWVWVNSRSWWWTGKPDVLQSMGLQRVGHDWVIEQNSEFCSWFQSVFQSLGIWWFIFREGNGSGGNCCDLWGHKESDTTEWLNWTGSSYIHRDRRWNVTVRAWGERRKERSCLMGKEF